MQRYELHKKAVYGFENLEKPKYFTQYLEEDDDGEWVRHEDAIIRTTELESTLVAAQEVNLWIPVTERLPEDRKRVIISTSEGNCAEAWRDDGEWSYARYTFDDHVIAWREFPAPYISDLK